MNFLFLNIASFLSISAPVAAQETDQYHSFLKDRFQLAIGVFVRVTRVSGSALTAYSTKRRLISIKRLDSTKMTPVDPIPCAGIPVKNGHSGARAGRSIQAADRFLPRTSTRRM